MGAGRRFPDLLQTYTDTYRNPPTNSLATLKSWSRDFGWAERAAAYDASWEQRKNAEREAVFNHGLSLDFERVRKLYRLAAFLEAQIFEQGENGVFHNIWLPDVKAIGSGEHAERVDIERFNSPLLEQYRKVLDDIAQETGGRAKRTELTGKDGGSINVNITDAKHRLATLLNRQSAESGAGADTGTTE